MSRFLPIVLATLWVACGNDPAAPPLECGTNLATDAELELTPRNDDNLEQLAIVATNRVVAGEAQYERVVRDVAKIRAMRPDLRDVGFLADFNQEIIVRADEGTISRMVEGTYGAWECLNRRFKVNDIEFGAGTPERADVTFDGVYHIPTLADRYARLPGIESATGGLRIGDGSTICVTPRGSDWHYVVDQGTGDCQSGCRDHDYSYFLSREDGAVTPSGSWAERSPDPKPAWVTSYVTPRACHANW